MSHDNLFIIIHQVASISVVFWPSVGFLNRNNLCTKTQKQKEQNHSDYRWKTIPFITFDSNIACLLGSCKYTLSINLLPIWNHHVTNVQFDLIRIISNHIKLTLSNVDERDTIDDKF